MVRDFLDDITKYILWAIMVLGVFIFGLYVGDKVKGSVDDQCIEIQAKIQKEIIKTRKALALHKNSVVIVDGPIAGMVGFKPRQRDFDMREKK